jgi:hypothetical protein
MNRIFDRVECRSTIRFRLEAGSGIFFAPLKHRRRAGRKLQGDPGSTPGIERKLVTQDDKSSKGTHHDT